MAALYTKSSGFSNAVEPIWLFALNESGMLQRSSEWEEFGLGRPPIILVVEDDHLIQGIVEDALADGGFEMAIAISGERAVELLDASDGKYRALVTDIGLGRDKMDGWEVAKHAREINPEFPVVYMSGESAGDWASKGVPNSIMLSKPFAPAQLVTAVSQLLNAGTPTT